VENFVQKCVKCFENDFCGQEWQQRCSVRLCQCVIKVYTREELLRAVNENIDKN